MIEIISLIGNVFNMLNKKHLIYVICVIILVFISSFLEIFAISLILPLFNFLFENEINTQFLALVKVIKNLSGFFTIDPRIMFGTVVFFALIISFLIKVIYIILNEKFAEIFTNKIVFEMYDKVYNANFEWIRHKNSTNVMQKIVQDAGSIGQATIVTAIELLYQLSFCLIGLSAIIYLLDKDTIGLIFLLVIFICFLIYLISPALKEQSEIQRSNQIKVIEMSSEFLRAVRFLKSSNLENYASSISKNTFSKSNKARRNVTILTKLFPTLVILTGQCLIIILVINQVLDSNNNSTQFVNLSVVAILLVRMLPIVSQVSGSYNRFVKLVPYYNSFINLKKSIKDKFYINKKPISKKRRFKNWKNFQISNLSYKISDNKIIENLNLSFKRNKIYGIIGNSGVGKTTLMDLISCLLTPQKGNLSVDKLVLNNKTKNEWMKEIGYAAQDPLIFDKSFEENLFLDFDNEKSSQKLINDIKKILKLDFLDNKKLRTLKKLGEQGINISGGQRQRIGIARAISKLPTLLILDEATSGMDRNLERTIRSNLKKSDSKPTIIIISHNIETLKNCESIIFFKKYDEMKSGSFKKLLLDNEFKSLLTSIKDR